MTIRGTTPPKPPRPPKTNWIDDVGDAAERVGWRKGWKAGYQAAIDKEQQDWDNEE